MTAAIVWLVLWLVGGEFVAALGAAIGAGLMGLASDREDWGYVLAGVFLWLAAIGFGIFALIQAILQVVDVVRIGVGA